MAGKKSYYFDNAATSWPKPESVYKAVDSALRTGGNPGRSGHRSSLAAERLLFNAREKTAAFFGIENPSSLVFSLNTTDALNMAIKGVLVKGGHVIITPFEHNSVLRPLNSLARDGSIILEEVPCTSTGEPDLKAYREMFCPDTALVIATHASNVTGLLLPVREMAAIAREKGVLFLLDAAQTAGAIPIDVKELRPHMLAFAGHKGLLGPPGIGGLYVEDGLCLKPWREGGTGSKSHQVLQPAEMPDYLEAGTQNIPGIAGLAAGIDYLQEVGLAKVREHEVLLAGQLREGLREIPGIEVYGPENPLKGVAVVSFELAGVDSGEVGYILEEAYGILCRTGLHCAPNAHRELGTFPRGTVRLSPGVFTTEAEGEYLLKAVREIGTEAR